MVVLIHVKLLIEYIWSIKLVNILIMGTSFVRGNFNLHIWQRK